MRQLFTNLSMLTCISLLIAGCAGTPKKVVEKPVAAAEVLRPVLLPEQQAQYKLAEEHIARGEFDKAEPIFTNLISLHSNLAGAYVNLGIINREQGNEEKAFASFEKALEINPANTDALAELGVLSMKNGEFSEAEDYLLKAEAVDPKLSEVQFNLGVIYELYLQDYDLAKEHYTNYVELGRGDDLKTVERWIKLLERK